MFQKARVGPGSKMWGRDGGSQFNEHCSALPSCKYLHFLFLISGLIFVVLEIVCWLTFVNLTETCHRTSYFLNSSLLVIPFRNELLI